jgi:hypothetical protein
VGASVIAIAGAADAESDRSAAKSTPMMIAPNFMMVLQISRYAPDVVLERLIALARLP